jgi:hypothetical protein
VTAGLQLLLPFPVAGGDPYDGAEFVRGAANRAALAWLDRGDWPDRRLAVWGEAGCGKTHMVAMWAGRAGARVLAGQALVDLSGVPEAGALAVDDADRVPSEETLLHLLNTARDRGLTVLLTGRTAPARWPVRLPDLSSRLRALVAVEVGPADDALLEALLLRLLARRQLGLKAATIRYLLLRMPRSPAYYRDAVASLDRESQAQGQSVTWPFAARVLGLGAVAGEDDISVAVESDCCCSRSLL